MSHPDHVAALRRDGFTIVPDVISDASFAPVREELSAFLDAKARTLQAQGKLSDLHEDLDFEHRAVALYAQCPTVLGGMDIMALRGRAMFEFLHCDTLLDLAEEVLGGELTCSPIQHVRAKMPISVESGGGFMNVPWHQDMGVTLEEADDTEVYTFWIPMIDATVETGCMEVIPGCRAGGLLPHVSGDYGTEVDPAHMPETEPIPAECPKRGVVVMDKYTPHRGMPNVSDKARWTIDLRYQVTGEPTGRPFHPNFPVRSRKHPETVTRDYDAWCQSWIDAFANGKGQRMHRV